MRKPMIKQQPSVAVPGLPDDAKKPGGGYPEETPTTVAKMPLVDNERARSETKPAPPVSPGPEPVRALMVVRPPAPRRDQAD